MKAPSSRSTGSAVFVVPVIAFESPALLVVLAVLFVTTAADWPACLAFCLPVELVRSADVDATLFLSLPERDPVSPLWLMLVPALELKLFLAESRVMPLYEFWRD